jgi:hypothetical protein
VVIQDFNMCFYKWGGDRAPGSSHSKRFEDQLFLPRDNVPTLCASPKLKSKLPNVSKATLSSLVRPLNFRRILSTPPSRRLRILSNSPYANRQQALLARAANSIIDVPIVRFLNPIKFTKESHFVSVVLTAGS